MKTIFSQRQRAFALIGTAIVALTVVGCQGIQQSGSSALSQPATENSQLNQSTLDDSPSQPDGHTHDATSIALPDWTVGAPATETDAFLAWEALMGPEGEYAALASYQAVLDTFGNVEPYATILEAEARHADALTRQLERFGVSVPDNPYLGLIPAPADLETAAAAWADGEVANVELYDRLITETDDSRLTQVFENLRRASAEMHLPAFQLAAESGGTLSAEEMTGLGSHHSTEAGNMPIMGG